MDELSLRRRVRWWATDVIGVIRGALYSRFDAGATGPRMSPTQASAAEQCTAWLSNYVGQPHPELGRKGDVCPFVNVSLRKQRIRLVVQDKLSGGMTRTIENAIFSEAWRLQRTLDPTDRLAELTASVLLFPNLAAADAQVLHAIHTEHKHSLMRRGLMLAVFFPGYGKPAIYNSDFQLYTAPIPAVVIRPMALHDIVFLDGHQGAFLEYHRRFAARYAANTVSDEFGYLRRFRAASERFGLVSSARPARWPRGVPASSGPTPTSLRGR